MFSSFLTGPCAIVKDYVLVFSNLFILNLLLSIATILLEGKKPTSTLLWVIVVNFLPVFGFILYPLLGQDMGQREIFTKKQSVDANLRRQTKR